MFIVIQDQQLLQRLSNRAKSLSVPDMSYSDRAMDTDNATDANIFHNAGTLIVIGSYATGQFVTADCWLAAENLMLTACSMGLGSCIIEAAHPLFNGAEIKAEFGIPAGYSAIAPIVVGYPSAATSPNSCQDPVVISIMEFNKTMDTLTTPATS